MPYEFVSGRHAVRAVLKNPLRQPSKLFLQTDLPRADVLDDIRREAKKRNVLAKEISRHTLEKKFSQSGKSHQGVVLISSPYAYADLENVIPVRAGRDPSLPTPFLLILDHIQDPHNLGALIRTAEIAGCTGVIIPKDRSCEITPTVIKTSAGASELVPIVRVINLNQTIEILKDKFLTVIGLETGGDNNIFQQDLSVPLALIIGSEGKGMAHLTRQKCDILAEIPMQGKTESLNASVAGAIAMYEVVRQRLSII